jgi:hypothetical protein
MWSKTLHRCLKPQIVPNSIYYIDYIYIISRGWGLLSLGLQDFQHSPLHSLSVEQLICSITQKEIWAQLQESCHDTHPPPQTISCLSLQFLRNFSNLKSLQNPEKADWLFFGGRAGRRLQGGERVLACSSG